MATELATAYISLVPTFKGGQGELAKGLMGEAGPAADKAGEESGKRFGGGLTKALGAAAIVGGAVAAFKGFYEIGNTFDEVSDTIRVGTGATGDALKGLEATAKAVAGSVPTDFAKAGQVVADVNTRLGLTGDTLQTVASQYTEAGRILGQDVDIAKTTAAFSAFKIEGVAVEGAMDSLFQVSQATGVGMNELAASVQANAPAMQNLGFSFEETTALVGSLDKAGLNSSATMASLSKGLVTLAKDGEEPQEAFRRVTSEIDALIASGDTAGAIDLASGVFGTRGASQFVGAVQSGTLALDDLVAATGATGDTILGVGKETQDAAESWQIFKNNALAALEPVGAALFSGLGGGMATLAGISQEYGPIIGDALGAGIEKATGAATGLYDLFVKGDFSATFREAFNVEEDSPVVGALFTIRELASTAFGEVTGGFRAMVAAFKEGGTDVTSSGFAGFLEQLGLIGRMLWDSLGPTISALLPQVLELVAAFSPLGLVLDVLTPVLPQVGEALSAIAGALSGTLASILPVVVSLMTTLAGVLSGALATILPTVVGLVLSLVDVFSGALVSLLPVVVGLVETLAGVLAELLPVLLPLITQGVQVLADILGGALGSVLPVIVGVISTLASVIAAVLPALLPVVSALVSGLLPIITSLLPPLMELVQAVFPLLATLILALLPAIGPLVKILSAVLVPVIGVLSGVLEFLIGVVANVITWFVDLVGGADGLKRGISDAWAGIQSAMTTVWNFIRDWIFNPIKSGVALVGDAFTAAKGVMTGAFDAVKTGVSSAWDWIRDNVFSKFETGVAAIGTAFEGARDTIKAAWNQIGNIARAPINFIIDTVYNKGIKAAFDNIAGAVGLSLSLPAGSLVPEFKAATGGVLPGFTPGRDVHHFTSPTGGRLHLSGGEAIMRPEFTRAVGGAAGVARLNAQARAGALGDRSFFLGGVWDNVKNAAGNVGQFVSNAASGVKDMVLNVAGFLSNPAEGFKSLITTPMNSLLSTVMGGDLGKMMVEVPRKAVTGIIDKALGLIGASSAAGGFGAGLPDMMAGGGWARPSRGRITSAFGPRWGAFHNGTDFAGGGATYASGAGTVSKVGWNVGYGNTGIGIMLNHGGGLETYYGHNPSMSAVRVRPGDTVRPGQHIGQEGATGNVTGVHLHWSAFRGGKAFNPMSLLGGGGGGGKGASVYDDGGWMNPGEVGVNLSTRPEPVFNAEQWEVLKGNLGNPGGGGDTYNVEVIATDESTAYELARQTVTALRDERTRAGLMGAGF